MAVLRYMETLEAPISHAEIADALKDLGFDRATIYRNLMDLTDAGLLSRVNLGENVWHFELRQTVTQEPGAEHPHFVCIDCGAVTCLDDVHVDIKTGSSLVAQISEVLIKGRCRKCVA